MIVRLEGLGGGLIQEQIAAEESVLQLVNANSLEHLRSFLQRPSAATVTKIISIPGLYRILERETDVTRFIPILEWIERRASEVLRGLIVEKSLEEAGASRAGVVEHDSDWKSVSAANPSSLLT